MYDDSKNGVAPGSNTKPIVNQGLVPVESNPYDYNTPTPEVQPNEAQVAQNTYYQQNYVDPSVPPSAPLPSSTSLPPSPPTYTASDKNGSFSTQQPGVTQGACPEDDNIEEFEGTTHNTTNDYDSSGRNLSFCGTRIEFTGNTIAKIIGTIFALFFLVYGIAMFSIAVSEFNKNVEMYPGAELVSPHVSIPILHWFFVVFAVGFCLCFAILGLELWFIHLIVGIIMVGFWIAYGCVAGLSKESEAALNPFSNGSYINYGQEMKQAIPYYRVYLYCVYYNRTGSRKGSLTTPGMYVYPDVHEDTSDITILQEYLDFIYRVQFQTKFVEGSKLIKTLENAEATEYKNRPEDRWNRRYECDPRRSVIIPNFKENIVVTKDETLPSSINNGVRVATEIFWAGAYYCYRFAARAIAVVVTLKKSLDMKSIQTFG